jgi:hypothetical protein
VREFDERVEPLHREAFLGVGSLSRYTDGLVERRDRSFDIGVEEMKKCLSDIRTHRRPAEVIDELLATLISTRRPTDDIAILVVEELSQAAPYRQPQQHRDRGRRHDNDHSEPTEDPRLRRPGRVRG